MNIAIVGATGLVGRKIIKLCEEFFDTSVEFQLFASKTSEGKILSVNDIDLAITRSGASTLSELVALRIPFIAVPLPKSKDNHQYFNAKHFEDKNLCWLINQNEFESDEIEKFINSLLDNKKEILLKKERVLIKNNKIKNFENIFWDPSKELEL